MDLVERRSRTGELAGADYAEVDFAAVAHGHVTCNDSARWLGKGKALVRRPRGIVALRPKADADPLSPCPSCGRLTRTVGRGACADCWNSKTPDGEPAVGRQSPRTEPLGLLDWLDDVPDIVWVLGFVAIAAVLIGVAVGLIA
jgi:hypothetical protein